MTTTAMDLLDAIREHLAAFELPELCSVLVVGSVLPPQVSVQLAEQEPPQIAAALLGWADTLTDPAAEAWRVPTGDGVHLAVSGLLPSGASVKIYRGIPATVRRLGVDLAPGDRTSVLLGALRHLAALGEVTA